MNDLVKEIHTTAKEKGWWDEPRSFGDIIALCHSELSEALDEYCNGSKIHQTYIASDGKPEGVPVELADVLIRIFDACGYYNIDIASAVKTKVEYNKGRPYRHGGKVL